AALGRRGARARRRDGRAAARARADHPGAAARRRPRRTGRAAGGDAGRRRRRRPAAREPRRPCRPPRHGGVLARHVRGAARRRRPSGRRPRRPGVLLRARAGAVVVGGAVTNGGIVMRWALEALAPDLGPGAEEALLALAAQAPPGSGGLLMAPYLMSERAPRWTSLGRGAFVGLTREHGRPHMVRAAIEGVALQLALVLDAMRAAGIAVDSVRGTGGVRRSALWQQLLA